jgi:hypothetical protein
MNDTDYQTDAITRLAQCGGKLRIRLSDTKPAPWDEGGNYRPHYRCTLTGPGGRYTFDFWASLNDGETGRTATAYDVLACLEWHTPDSFEEFCSEFGSDTDSRKAHRTWRSCLAMTAALHRVFPSESARECLANIR